MILIHYDFPEKLTAFIHRSGRTGRMGAAGQIISLVTPSEEAHVKKFYGELAIKANRKALPRGPASPSASRNKKQTAKNPAVNKEKAQVQGKPINQKTV